MSEQKKGITRREFINKGIKGAGLVGLGGAIGLTASRFLPNTTGEKLSGVGGRSGINPDPTTLKELSAVDPALIRYREAGKINMGLQHPRAITVGPDDRIYVAAGKTIQVFDGDTAPLSEVRMGDSPRCLTVTDDGTVYVGMRGHVEVYSPKGICRAKWDTPGQRAVLTSIAVSENDVFVADAGSREVLRYDASGKLVRRIGKRDKSRNTPGFVVPSPYFDLAISPDGLLRVANPGQHRVEAYTFDGDFGFAWGDPSIAIDGFCGCCNPVNFAMLPDGRFATCEKGLPRVKVYNADGVFESVVAAAESFAENGRACTLDGPSNCQTGGMDIAVDSRGRVLVMDPVEKVVRIFAQIEGV